MSLFLIIVVNAYGLNGMGIEAVELYRKIPNDLRDEVSHLCALNACSHAGLLNECRHIFNQIPHKTAKIVTTMVRFSRSADLSENMFVRILG